MPQEPSFATIPLDSLYDNRSHQEYRRDLVRVRVAKAKAVPKAPKPARAGYGPHCQVIRPPQGGLAFGAIWNGRRSAATFTSEAGARAWLATCDVAGKFRY